MEYQKRLEKACDICLPLAYQLYPVIENLKLEDELEYLDDDDYSHMNRYMLKKMIIHRAIQIFLKENEGIYEPEIIDKVYDLFK